MGDDIEITIDAELVLQADFSGADRQQAETRLPTVVTECRPPGSSPSTVPPLGRGCLDVVHAQSAPAFASWQAARSVDHGPRVPVPVTSGSKRAFILEEQSHHLRGMFVLVGLLRGELGLEVLHVLR